LCLLRFETFSKNDPVPLCKGSILNGKVKRGLRSGVIFRVFDLLLFENMQKKQAILFFIPEKPS
jgi:hypothetical protein